MKVLLVGGGSGGHITPLIAIAEKLKEEHPKAVVVIVSERRGVFDHLLADASDKVDSIFYINAGKYRRYNGIAFYKKLLDIRTILFNIRDIFKLALGTMESIMLLIRIRPKVVFIKGGYVGVPMGLASRLLRIPYVTHDSDAIPGLTNRIIANEARKNAVGMPVENYNYDKDKTVFVGIPVTADFLNSSIETRKTKRRELELKSTDFLIFVTGGSNGAQRLDQIVHDGLINLLEKNSSINIVHQVGKGNEELYADYPFHLHSRIRVASFYKPLSAYLAAADLVIARAGATSIAEIGLMKKPAIIVPSPYLSGGHQLKNAKVYEDEKAAIIVQEQNALNDPNLLKDILNRLVSSSSEREKLAQKLHSMTVSNATERISNLLVGIANKQR